MLAVIALLEPLQNREILDVHSAVLALIQTWMVYQAALNVQQVKENN